MDFLKTIKSLFRYKDSCITCSTRIKGLLHPEWIYRKKCPNCQTVNYRVKVYSWDHNNYILKLGTKEEYETEKKQWDNYFSDIYPRELLRKEFWDDQVIKATKRAEEKKWEKETPDEVKIEILLSRIEQTDDLQELVRLHYHMMETRLKLNQFMLWSKDFAKFLYYEQFKIFREQKNEHEIWMRENISIELNNFDSICKNTTWNLKWIFNVFEEWNISLLDLRNEFYDYANNFSKAIPNWVFYLNKQ